MVSINDKQNELPFNKFANSQFVTNISSLHDPYDLNHIHGLRNRLFKTFSTFATILENALLPPVSQNTKKIKIKDCDQQTNRNFIHDFNLMLSEIKHDSKNENLHSKKSKANAMLKTIFQIKVIQCYKLAINATELCSKTLEANIYNPIQSKMKNLIQLISTLSFTTGKYIYGASFKKKKKESFDLVARCKELVQMLEESGYKDEVEDKDEVHESSVLNQLTNKALAKPKTLLSNPNRLSMYNHSKPKLGSMYAQRWSKKHQDIANKNYSNTNSEINEKPLLLNSIISDNHKDIRTVIQEYPIEEHDISNETNRTFSIEKKSMKDEKMENNMSIIYTDDELTNFQTSSTPPKLEKLKTPNNVKLVIVKENIWRNFIIKNVSLSQNGCLRLTINKDEVQSHILYKKQFRQMCLTTVSQMDTISNITELIMEDLLKGVLSRIVNDSIVKKMLNEELYISSY